MEDQEETLQKWFQGNYGSTWKTKEERSESVTTCIENKKGQDFSAPFFWPDQKL